MNGYWFKFSELKIEPGEDQEINSGVCGQLAQWLKQKLIDKGYRVEDILQEEWGQCLMCRREPIKLWVGCKSAHTAQTPSEETVPPRADQIVWYCFVAAEVPHFVNYFLKVDTEPAKVRLYSDLGEILRGEPAVMFVKGS